MKRLGPLPNNCGQAHRSLCCQCCMKIAAGRLQFQKPWRIQYPVPWRPGRQARQPIKPGLRSGSGACKTPMDDCLYDCYCGREEFALIYSSIPCLSIRLDRFAMKTPQRKDYRLTLSHSLKPPATVRWGAFTHHSIPLLIGVTDQ